MSEDSNDQNFARLCDLQQRQLDKLNDISRQLAESTEAAKQCQEEYVRQGIAYEEALSEYRSSDRLVAKIVTWRAILISLMLGLIAVSILIQWTIKQEAEQGGDGDAEEAVLLNSGFTPARHSYYVLQRN